MKTLNTILTLTLGLTCASISAQSVTASAGETYTNSSAQMSFTLGETVIETVANDSNTLTQGFHQTKLEVVGIVETIESVQVKIWPNPTSDYVTIDFGNNQGEFDLILLSSSGQLIHSEKLGKTTNHQIDLTKYANGNYLLNVVNRSNPASRNTYQIIKTY